MTARSFADYLNNRVTHEVAVVGRSSSTTSRTARASHGRADASLGNLTSTRLDLKLRALGTILSLDARQASGFYRDMEHRLGDTNGAGWTPASSSWPENCGCRGPRRWPGSVRGRPTTTTVRLRRRPIGGTGFSRAQLVAGLVARGLRVSVLARNTNNLQPLFTASRSSYGGRRSRRRRCRARRRQGQDRHQSAHAAAKLACEIEATSSVRQTTAEICLKTAFAG